MHQYIEVWAWKPKPAASSVVVRYKCIKLYISAKIQPILMNEHSFCTIWNAPDCVVWSLIQSCVKLWRYGFICI